MIKRRNRRILCAAPLSVLCLPMAVQAAIPLEQALETRPVLSTVLGSHVRLEQAAAAAGLSRRESAALEALVRSEKEAVLALRELSQPIIADDRLSSEEMRARLEALDFHGRVLELAQGSRRELQALLEPAELTAFLAWAGETWEADSQRTGMTTVQKGGVTYTQFTVFATQYDAYTSDEVAVPDKYVKFAAQGTQYASGYPPDLDYRVTLYHDSYTYTVRVYEVGPWNIDDNYWNAADDPERPRRMFTDLAQGTPEAEAAYYYNYNNGLDQYGRDVLNPGGIDLAVEVAPKLGLDYLENDWVTVDYMWEDGSTTSTGNLVGYIRENDIYSGAGIVGATVTLSTGASMTTDSDGYYKFTGVAAGTYTVTADADCYGAASTSKAVEAGIDNWASIALEQDGSCGGDGGDGSTGCSRTGDIPDTRGHAASINPGERLPLRTAGLFLGLGGALIAWRRRR